MCVLRNAFAVSVLLCVLLWSGRAQESGPCRVSAEAGQQTSVNCSRQQFHDIPDLSPLAKHMDESSQLLLTFYNNSISNLTQLPALPGTRVAVIFKNNTIKDIVDSAFKNIHRIVYLDLSNNKISGEVLRSEIFQGPFQDDSYDCISLETLNLGNNQIHSLDKYLFKHTPNLTRLSLNNNPIEILDTVTVLALSSAVKLKYLDLSKTDINSIPLDAFRGLVNLEHIDLSSNKFVTVPESLALVGTSLQYLTFNDNPIVELNDDSFVGLSSLLELEVGENEYLEEIKRSTFTPLKSLRVLHLCHNPNLRYISHNAFRGLKDKWTLKEVYLDDNNLSELSTDLMPWSKLELLGMTGNNWLCNCDLVNIVTTQGAGQKFRTNEIAYCAAPMKLSGQNVTSVSLNYCPTFDTTYAPPKKGMFSNMKPKHVLWSIFGVAIVVVIGMLIGLLVNSLKLFYKKKIRSAPIRYVNIVNDSNYA